MLADLHCHTKLSDGSMGIDDLVVLAQKRGVTTLAITDRDCQAGTVRGKIIGERRGITVIPGVEISSYDSGRGKCVEILAYLCDSPDRLEGVCHRNVLARKKASRLMTLKASRKYPITPELVLKCASGSTAVFEQHIMHALLECGVTDKIYGDVYEELFTDGSPDNILVKTNYPEPAEVIEAVRESGGIAVLAHPGKYRDAGLIEELAENGLDGFEAWHPDNSEELTEKLLVFARENDMLALGGTEFMGMYSKNPISVGEFSTPEPYLKALMGYKTRMKKKRTVMERAK